MGKDGTVAQEQLERMRQELREREGEIAMLLETGRLIISELDLDKVFQAITESARTLVKAETLLLPLLTADRSAYTYLAGSGANVDEIVGQTLPIDYGLCGWVLRNQKPWWQGALSELNDEERNLWEHEAGSVILVPLVGRRSFLGGIAGINKQGGGNFTERDLNLLQLFAAQAAIAIENAQAMEKAEMARKEAERHQLELQRLNKRLNAVNLQLEQMSLFDALTGMPNRTLFRDRCHHAIAAAGASGRPLAIAIIDIDKFQEINNSFGQEAGDALLKETARLLDEMIGHDNTLSRISGDEFAALLVGADAMTASSLARAINDRLAAGVTLEENLLHISASIGIAVMPDHGHDLSELMKSADLAMNVAKRDRCGIHVFDSIHDATIAGRFALTHHLRKALDRQEFSLYYQPKLDLASGRIYGCEALARWLHPQRGMVPPDMFITALEQTNLILPFTHWAIETAWAQRQAWLAKGWNIAIAVNVPPMVLLNPEFMAFLEAHDSLRGIDFELTENIFLGDLDRLAGIAGQLRIKGIGLSIDDFGTGYSSLQRLRQTAVDEIKIDRSFIKDMMTSKDDTVIVRSTIDLAHNLGLRVVGEGVEDARTLERLTQLRCDSVQGYHICRPLPADTLGAFLDASAWPPHTTTATRASA